VFATRKNSLAQVLNRELATTRKLIADQHQEFMSYQARRDREAKRREEEAKRREEEAKRREEERKQEGEARTVEMREFMREILLRNEKVYTAMIAEMEEGRKQIAANTKAVLSVLDRLNGSAPAT